MMVALVARLDLRDDAAAAESDLLTEEAVAMIIEREPGTVVYATRWVDGESLARVFYEVYRDAAAFAAHEQADHVRSFDRRKDPLVVAAGSSSWSRRWRRAWSR